MATTNNNANNATTNDKNTNNKKRNNMKKEATNKVAGKATNKATKVATNNVANKATKVDTQIVSTDKSGNIFSSKALNVILKQLREETCTLSAVCRTLSDILNNKIDVTKIPEFKEIDFAAFFAKLGIQSDNILGKNIVSPKHIQSVWPEFLTIVQKLMDKDKIVGKKNLYCIEARETAYTTFNNIESKVYYREYKEIDGKKVAKFVEITRPCLRVIDGNRWTMNYIIKLARVLNNVSKAETKYNENVKFAADMVASPASKLFVKVVKRSSVTGRETANYVELTNRTNITYK